MYYISYERIDGMAKIEGCFHCERCNSEIKWCYLIRQHISSSRILEVDAIPDDTIVLSSNPKEMEVKVHCRNCDYLNIINVDTVEN